MNANDPVSYADDWAPSGNHTAAESSIARQPAGWECCCDGIPRTHYSSEHQEEA